MTKFAALSDDEFYQRIKPDSPINPEIIEEGIMNTIKYDLYKTQSTYGL